MGAILVLGGLTVASLEKQKNKRRKVSTPPVEDRKSGNETAELISVPHLPLSNGADESGGHIVNGDVDPDNERQPLMSLDVEIGRSSTASGNGPERRR